ncbi:MAG: 4-hydroxy-3-methylbut-2-enyl diphosphate reductase [Acidimicrobiales bacterium]|nr:4-hydroxy-3-methylbut-2-enyl diphosphate reductase [Acidimicrobiales bacterium]
MNAQVEKVVLANPRGFWAGVEMAIKALARMVERFEPPVYCYHDIVHNDTVVDLFERAGVVFVDTVEDVPHGAPLMLSAHGTAPEVVAAARERAGVVVDAACPLVAKVHHELKRRVAEGFAVVYVGHAGHDEAVGTVAVAPEAVQLVETREDVDALSATDRPVALLSQTTLSFDDWTDVYDAVRARFPDVWTPSRSDLCFATTNRQRALRALVERVDAVVVIGSATSSNTNALERVARESGCDQVIRIDTAGELPAELSGTVGVTAGASVPESIVAEVVERLAPRRGVEVLTVTAEDEYFPLPRELRAMLAAADLAADRRTSAGSALARLAERVGPSETLDYSP